MNAANSWILIPIFGILAWVVTTWIRARHGYPLEDSSMGGDEKIFGPHLSKQELKAELAARDRTLAELEERVRVLERIVTDRTAELDQEIDRLRA